jgi:hypothetical protein
MADVRVYCGHWQMTIDEPRKRAEQERFFTKPQDPRARAKWLTTAGARWVIWYPWEWGEKGISPGDVPGLTPQYKTAEITLYRFDPKPR